MFWYLFQSVRVERLLVSDVRKCLVDALGGEVSEDHMSRLLALIPLSGEHIEKENFVIVAALAERLFCYGNLSFEFNLK